MSLCSHGGLKLKKTGNFAKRTKPEMQINWFNFFAHIIKRVTLFHSV